MTTMFDEQLIRRITRQVLQEVRYLNNNRQDEEKPLLNEEVIRVFHGTNIETAVQMAKYGFSGKQEAMRTYSYEAWMNPVGIFVTTDFKVATRFGNSESSNVIIEFSCKSDDLDTPVWNDSDSYFTSGTNPQPFKSKQDRDQQKYNYNRAARANSNQAVAKSDNPAMVYRLFDKIESQALFIGDVAPNQIKEYGCAFRPGEMIA